MHPDVHPCPPPGPHEGAFMPDQRANRLHQRERSTSRHEGGEWLFSLMRASIGFPCSTSCSGLADGKCYSVLPDESHIRGVCSECSEAKSWEEPRPTRKVAVRCTFCTLASSPGTTNSPLARADSYAREGGARWGSGTDRVARSVPPVLPAPAHRSLTGTASATTFVRLEVAHV